MSERVISNSVGQNFNAEIFLQQRMQLLDKLTHLTPDIEKTLDPDASSQDQAFKFSRLSFGGMYLDLSSDPELALASVLNINSVRGSTRLSGRPYATHPMLAAWMGLTLTPDSSPEVRRQTALLALVHDVFEEDTLKAANGKKQQAMPLVDLSLQPTEMEALAQARLQINQLFTTPKIGDSVVLLMEPLVPDESRRDFKKAGYDDFLITYSYFGEQLRASSNPAIAHAEIADRIDDIADLEHLTKSSRSNEDKRRILLNKFAKCYFTVQHISEGKKNLSPFMVKAFYEVLGYVVQENNMNMDTVSSHADRFKGFILNESTRISTDLVSYLRDTGISID